MRREKRVWIYAGLGVPQGTALVRKGPVGPPAGGLRILLAGREEAQGLVAPLARLASDAGVSLRVDHRPGTTARDWADNPWLSQHLLTFRPTAVFFVADPSDVAAARKLAAIVARAGVPLLWLTPGPSTAKGALSVPARDLTASGYAAWAGQAWAMVR